MADIKRRHHYVWANYLRAWSDSRGSLNVYSKKQAKHFTTNPINVALEKDFYRIERLQHWELEEIDILTRNASEGIKQFDDLVLSMFDLNKFQNFLKIEFGISEAHFHSKSHEVQSNYMENFHTAMENKGRFILCCKSFEDLKQINDEENLVNTLNFLALQYCRTKSIRDALKNVYKLKGREMSNTCINIISLLMAARIVINLISSDDLKIELLSTDYIPFNTCDQPVINILKGVLDSKNNIAHLQFYFPLTPHLALLIDTFGRNKEKLSFRKIPDDQVAFYNNKMSQDSQDFIFTKKSN